MAIVTKEKRIEFRLSEKDKQTIENAARLSNTTLSSYILSTVLKQAKLDLGQNVTISLSSQDRDKLIKALENSSEPNKSLKELFRWF